MRLHGIALKFLPLMAAYTVALAEISKQVIWCWTITYYCPYRMLIL